MKESTKNTVTSIITFILLILIISASFTTGLYIGTWGGEYKGYNECVKATDFATMSDMKRIQNTMEALR